MFGWKNKYNDLLSKYQHLQDDCTMLKEKYNVLKQHYDRLKHPCNVTCIDCKHCIVLGNDEKERYREYVCELDNHCEKKEQTITHEFLENIGKCRETKTE